MRLTPKNMLQFPEDKKLSYRRETARRAMLVNLCYVSRAVGVIKVSNSKTAKVTFKVIQGHHWQWCHSIGHMRFLINLPLQLCLYLAPFSRYYQLFPKI